MVQAQKKISQKGKVVPTEIDNHMDILMINALLQSLFTIFSTMMNLNIIAGIPAAKKGSSAKGEVTGLIGMKAEGACGSVALTLPLPAIRAISQSLLGEEIASINKEATDLVGELTNMLVGGAKRILSEKGHDFDMQTPQLFTGQGHDIVHLVSGQTVLMPIEIGKDEFYLELNFV